MRRTVLLGIIGIALVWMSGTLVFAAGPEDGSRSDAPNEEMDSSEESGSGSAEAEKDGWYIGPRIGYSKFTGFLGLEAQKHNFALAVGMPWTIGVKYYFSPRGHSAFMGAFFSQWGFEDNDGDDIKRTEIGIGGGYRWRWRDALDLTLGAAIFHAEREEEHRFFTETDKYNIITPTLTVGYSF